MAPFYTESDSLVSDKNSFLHIPLTNYGLKSTPLGKTYQI
jgi:hypothetical protein